MYASRKPLSALFVLGAAAASMSACSGYDAPLPPKPAIVVAAKPPPPISGGTMIVSNDGRYAIAADPDRDRVFAVDLTNKTMVMDVALETGDEPGRVIEASDGRVFVALRGAGSVAVVNYLQRVVESRTPVCSAPRGMAYDADLQEVHLACAGGELITLDGADATELRRTKLESDLRDIVIDGEYMLVSRFRSAEVLRISKDGLIMPSRVTFQALTSPGFDEFSGEEKNQVFEPEVAYRMVGLPEGGAAVLHQRAMTTPVKISTGGYGDGGCDNSVVHGTVGVIPASEQGVDYAPAVPLGSSINGAILPVDLAYSGDSAGGAMAIVSAGSSKVVIGNRWGDFESGAADPCGFSMTFQEMQGTPIAVVWSETLSDFVVQTREPSAIVALGNAEIKVETGGVSVYDTGHQMFHTNPNGQSSLACASCHPEGRDDGRTWVFDPIGPRRTPTLGGGIVTTTSPLHWDGDMTDGLETIMQEVFVNRMGGQQSSPRRISVFADWLDALPAFQPNTPDDSDAVTRGEAIFNDKAVGCATCHSGKYYTNNETVDVGTGLAFQVPPLLGLGSRAPYMHDGCAKTLADRFAKFDAPGRGTCGGDRHGDVSQLSEAQLGDLIAFLETL